LRTPLTELLAIQGIGEKTAEKLLEEARGLQEKRGRELAEEAARAEAEAALKAEAAIVPPPAPATVPDEVTDAGRSAEPEADHEETTPQA